MSLKQTVLVGGILAATSAASVAAPERKRCTGLCQEPHEKYGSPRMYGVMEEKKLWWRKEAEAGVVGTTSSSGPAECVDGMAGEYPCSGVDLLSFVSLPDLGSSGAGNDIWGWTDSEGNEFVIAGCADGSSFV